MADGTRRRKTGDKLSARLLGQARIIAKGRRIRDVERLVRRYGGRAAKWVKKSIKRKQIKQP
jgi:hypothetical protein